MAAVEYAPAAELEDLAVRVPRTQVVMLTAVCGFLLGPAIVYFDAPSWSKDVHDFVKNGPFQLWTAIMGAQTLLWTLALPSLVATFRRHRQSCRSLRREVVPSAVTLVAFVALIVALPAATDPWPSFFPHIHLKVRLLTGGALITALVASSSIWMIRGEVERLARGQVTDAMVQAYCGLRSELNQLLAFLGAVVGLAVLGSAELRRVWLLAPHVGKQDFAPEAVIMYGLVLSFVLALVFIPTYLTFQSVGAQIRDEAESFPKLANLEEGLERRRLLDDLLGLRASASTTFKIATALLAPLLGSLTGILPKLG